MLEVKNLCKSFSGFKLQNVSFELEKGYIMGFVGRNGAGKSTTLKSILNIIRPDGGQIKYFGKDIKDNELEIKQKVSFTLGAFDYYTKEKLKNIAAVYKIFYKDWDESLYESYTEKFNLDGAKRVCELSAGMKVKFALALALSHNAELFIFDEPTSGLDPIARDELLNIFREIIADGQRSILFSTHITSDLDKCADYVMFIKNGQIIANDSKDALLDGHAVIKGALSELTDDLKQRLISYKTNSYGFSGLIAREKISDGDNFQTQKPDLEDIMIYYEKETER